MGSSLTELQQLWPCHAAAWQTAAGLYSLLGSAEGRSLQGRSARLQVNWIFQRLHYPLFKEYTLKYNVNSLSVGSAADQGGSMTKGPLQVRPCPCESPSCPGQLE